MKDRECPPGCEPSTELWAFAERRLGPAEQARVSAHLEQCADCRAELEAMRATRELLDVAEQEMPPAPLQEALPAPRPRAPLANLLPANLLPAKILPESIRPGPGVLAGLGLAACGLAAIAALGFFTRPSEVPALFQAQAPAAPGGEAPSPRASGERAGERGPASIPSEEALATQGLEPLGPSCEQTLHPLKQLGDRTAAQAQREMASVLRARCLARMGRMLEADVEYRLYLQDFPQGLFAQEARGAVAH